MCLVSFAVNMPSAAAGISKTPCKEKSRFSMLAHHFRNTRGESCRCTLWLYRCLVPQFWEGEILLILGQSVWGQWQVVEGRECFYRKRFSWQQSDLSFHSVHEKNSPKPKRNSKKLLPKPGFIKKIFKDRPHIELLWLRYSLCMYLRFASSSERCSNCFLDRIFCWVSWHVCDEAPCCLPRQQTLTLEHLSFSFIS